MGNIWDYIEQLEREGQPEQPEAAPEPMTELEDQIQAREIIKKHRLNHEMAAGCRAQILQDLEQRQNPYKIILFAAEAIGRLDYKGDGFFLQVLNKYKELYGYDISELDAGQIVKL